MTRRSTFHIITQSKQSERVTGCTWYFILMISMRATFHIGATRTAYLTESLVSCMRPWRWRRHQASTVMQQWMFSFVQMREPYTFILAATKHDQMPKQTHTHSRPMCWLMAVAVWLFYLYICIYIILGQPVSIRVRYVSGVCSITILGTFRVVFVYTLCIWIPS